MVAKELFVIGGSGHATDSLQLIPHISLSGNIKMLVAK